jgi:LysM repeat protein
MLNKLHNTWIILAAIWLSIAPTHAHAAHTYRQQAANISGITLQSKTAGVARASSAGCANPYTVRSGDTLAKISRRCGVSVSSLKRLNGLSGNTILVGQALVIRASRAKAPASGRPIATPAPTPTIESTISPW